MYVFCSKSLQILTPYVMLDFFLPLTPRELLYVQLRENHLCISLSFFKLPRDTPLTLHCAFETLYTLYDTTLYNDQ